MTFNFSHNLDSLHHLTPSFDTVRRDGMEVCSLLPVALQLFLTGPLPPGVFQNDGLVQ